MLGVNVRLKLECKKLFVLFHSSGHSSSKTTEVILFAQFCLQMIANIFLSFFLFFFLFYSFFDFASAQLSKGAMRERCKLSHRPEARLIMHNQSSVAKEFCRVSYYLIAI